VTYKISFIRGLLLTCAVAGFTLLSGCSAVPKEDPGQIPAQKPVSALPTDQTYAIDIYDPWEGFNRSMYRFNARFDQYVFLPVVSGYETVMPDVAETGVSNFFNNVGEIKNLTNAMMQLKGKRSLNTAGRLFINTTVGLFGLFDVASKMEVYEQKEDFGQTLGHYGVGDGPYIVLPVLGPSNLRDTGGLATDAVIFAAIDPFDFDGESSRAPPYYLLNAIDTRHQNKFRYYASGSPFEYELIRMLYTHKRELDIAR